MVSKRLWIQPAPATSDVTWRCIHHARKPAGKSFNTRAAVFALPLVLIAAVANAEIPYLVSDITPGSAGTNPTNLTAVGQALFFTSYQSDGGVELWKSSGTAAGTSRLADLPSGSSLNYLVAAGDRLFFRGTSSQGTGLCTSDGTEAGTVPLVAIQPLASAPVGTFSMAAMNGTLFFTNFDSELWRSDGTVAGTVPFFALEILRHCTFIGCFDIAPEPAQLTNVSGTLFFVNGPSWASHELWKSDGTTDGTARVAPIFFYDGPFALTDFNGTLFFAAGSELWRSDGTPEGTLAVADIGGPDYDGATNLTVVSGTLYFSGTEPVAGRELWRSDGTTAGTVRVADINPGAGDSTPGYLTAVGNTLFFTAFDPAHGVELWKSDGTAGGTVRVADIAPGASSSDPSNLVVVDGSLLFSAYDPSAGRELWTSDGLVTSRVADLWPGSSGSNPTGITNVSGTPFFAASAPDTGTELYIAGCPPDPSAPDTDGDGTCDAFDSCTNVAGGQDFLSDVRARITLSNINNDATVGNDGLRLSGVFAFASGTFADLDPATNGMRVIVSNAAGTGTPVDVSVPAGTFAGTGTRGWYRGPRGDTWTFRDATAAPVNGITRINVADRSRRDPRQVGVTVKGRNGIYPAVPGDEPLHATVVLGSDRTAAMLGYCGEQEFSADQCAFNSAGRVLTCRQ